MDKSISHEFFVVNISKLKWLTSDFHVLNFDPQSVTIKINSLLMGSHVHSQARGCNIGSSFIYFCNRGSSERPMNVGFEAILPS